jgi:Aminoglycoside-2''-adenylyltransferase
MPELPRVDDPEEAAFQRRYGPWQAWTPRQAADVLGDWTEPWWIAGGWAVEAFTGRSRRHEDIDISIFRRDVPSLWAYLDPTYHCWAVGSGQLGPIDEKRTELPEWADQVWVREHAWQPWLADVVTSRDDDGRWVFKRDPSVTAPLDEVTWTAADGIRYLNPEIALAYKAKHDRPKDDADLDATWPKLDDRQRVWLRDTIARLHPDHRWLARLT